jgi:hypothetical protein
MNGEGPPSGGPSHVHLDDCHQPQLLVEPTSVLT